MAGPGLFWRLKWLCLLLLMMVLDISPIPFSGAACVYIFLARPRWFKRFVERLYSAD
ncbi:hypothetical protein NP590_15775 [Methylomonas sp. SURF-2]|uniref:Uncharacterized protein n=1 Tax=Methylomonas subterranea TaxID=2952225 RepID=A0ABT1TJG1_9GAMM|nr:hypothetical protein [Methylomonas sp. SURF-2]MCQ8105570.1 hypothetical protein [Methylomonas sp. SURF-2]